MKISKAVVLSLWWVFMTAGLWLMFVSAAEKTLELNLDNAVQHFNRIKFISSWNSNSVVDMTRVWGLDPLIKIGANNFVITQTWSTEKNTIGWTKGNTVLGWVSNNVSSDSYSTVLGWSGNKTASYSDTILWWVNNNVNNGSYSIILGWSGNKVNNSYVVILWWSDNEVTSQYWLAIWKNVHALRRTNAWNSVALWLNATVEADNSFLWSDGTTSKLAKDKVFAVNWANGMVVNSDEAHSFAKLTIWWSLVIKDKNEDFACNANLKWVLRLQKKDWKTCFCSCDGTERNSVIWGGVCVGICNTTRAKAQCNTWADLRITCNATNTTTAGKVAYVVENWCEKWNVVQWTWGYLVDEENKMHWTCMEDNWHSVECKSLGEVQACNVH